MDYILRTFGLCKKYKRQKAVDHADMTIRKGDIYGFVGENGSGKTTIIRLITGLIFPCEGSFELFGVSNTDPKIGEVRRKMGAVVESPSIYQNMSARENLQMQCMILGIEDQGKIRKTLEIVGLAELYDEPKHAGDYSLGMRQRLGIAMALLGDPEFLILDEPMNGLDPAGIVDIRELILRLNREHGITFLISSHILTELSLVATKYGIISKGHIIKEITAEQLHQECGKITVIQANDTKVLETVLRAALPQHNIAYVPAGLKIAGEVNLNMVLQAVLSAGIQITSINCSESSFEDYYLSMIGGVRNA